VSLSSEFLDKRKGAEAPFPAMFGNKA